MDDKTLLERAAKAAGIDDAEWQDMEGWGEVRHGFSNAIWSEALNEAHGTGYWNPLVDDGDALSLSVKLRINIEHGQYSVRAWTDDDAPVMVDETVFTPDESQRQFAMREAITRAAAAIGSAHEPK